jgi:hypothetical protein
MGPVNRGKSAITFFIMQSCPFFWGKFLLHCLGGTVRYQYHFGGISSTRILISHMLIVYLLGYTNLDFRSPPPTPSGSK